LPEAPLTPSLPSLPPQATPATVIITKGASRARRRRPDLFKIEVMPRV
jgi:hypothetical protein